MQGSSLNIADAVAEGRLLDPQSCQASKRERILFKPQAAQNAEPEKSKKDDPVQGR